MKDDANRTFWQKYARLYSTAMKSSGGLYGEICGLIRPKLGGGARVLELACGTGQLTFQLCECAAQYDATDFSDAMITEAKKRACPPQLHFSVQDATHLPYPPASFDAVIISNALHIMPEPTKALAEIKRVLKPDGTLFAPTFVHSEGRAFKLRVKIMELGGFRVFHHWNAEQFVDFLNQNGFAVEESCLIGGSISPLCFAAARPEKT